MDSETTKDLNLQFVQSIRTFADEKGLNIFWNLPDNDRIEEVSYTYRNTVNNITSTSTIDHFFSNERFYSSVTKAGMIIHPDNMSGHLPTFCLIWISLIWKLSD